VQSKIAVYIITTQSGSRSAELGYLDDYTRYKRSLVL